MKQIAATAARNRMQQQHRSLSLVSVAMLVLEVLGGGGGVVRFKQKNWGLWREWWVVNGRAFVSQRALESGGVNGKR